jgi:hypothetical protein
VVLGLANTRPIEAKTAKPDRYARIKVLDPRQSQGTEFQQGVAVSLSDQAGKEIASLIVGKTRSIQTADREGWFYVRKPDEARCWLVATRLEVADNIKGWLDIDVPRLDRKRLRAVTGTRPEGDPVNVSRPDSETTDFKVDDMPDGMEMIHDTAANSMASALGFVTFDDVAKAEGFDFSGGSVTEYRTFDGEVITVRVIERDGKPWAHFSAAYDADGVRLEQVTEADKDKMLPEEKVKEEVERLNKRFGPWAYNLPRFKADDFTTPLGKLIVAKKQNAS